MFADRSLPGIMPSEPARACSDHPVAFCPRCQVGFKPAELAYAALAPTPHYRCPRCRMDLSQSLALHAQTCPGR